MKPRKPNRSQPKPRKAYTSHRKPKAEGHQKPKATKSQQKASTPQTVKKKSQEKMTDKSMNSLFDCRSTCLHRHLVTWSSTAATTPTRAATEVLIHQLECRRAWRASLIAQAKCPLSVRNLCRFPLCFNRFTPSSRVKCTEQQATRQASSISTLDLIHAW